MLFPAHLPFFVEGKGTPGDLFDQPSGDLFDQPFSVERKQCKGLK